MSIPAPWFYSNDGVAQGPFESAAMTALWREGTLSRQTLVWQPGQTEWQEIGDLAPDWRHDPDLLPSHLLARVRPIPTRESSRSEPETAPLPPGMPGPPPEHRRLKPIAPSSSTPALPPEKPGLLRRLFGRGR
jgi:hypothetical protein